MVRYVIYIYNGVFLLAKHVKVYQTKESRYVLYKKGMDSRHSYSKDGIGSLIPNLAREESGFFGNG